MKTNKECPFCMLDTDREVLCESPDAIAFLDKFPVSPGHALVVPRRHVADYFSLAEAEQQALWHLVNMPADAGPEVPPRRIQRGY